MKKFLCSWDQKGNSEKGEEVIWLIAVIIFRKKSLFVKPLSLFQQNKIESIK